MYRFNAISIRIPIEFSKEIDQTFLKFIWSNKASRIVKAPQEKKTKMAGASLYYKAVVIMMFQSVE